MGEQVFVAAMVGVGAVAGLVVVGLSHGWRNLAREAVELAGSVAAVVRVVATRVRLVLGWWS